MSEGKKTVVVIGGGAAGYFAAITAAQTNPSLRVILLEGLA
jgi:succinate dehydrogenase/fumarate reductase flavoprotein subunit